MARPQRETKMANAVMRDMTSTVTNQRFDLRRYSLAKKKKRKQLATNYVRTKLDTLKKLDAWKHLI